MDSRNRILIAMGEAGPEATMDAIRRYLVVTTKTRSTALQSLISDGSIEPAEVEDGARLSPDGRPVFWFGHDAWVPTREAHNARMQSLFRAAKDKASTEETKSVAGTESMTSMTCPKCGDALQHSSVCPACAAGKLGYHHRYTCVCGGVDLVSKDVL
jgi:hypothetical protein